LKKPVVAPPTKTDVFEPAVVGERLKKWLPDLSPAVIHGLLTYQGELVKANKTIPLIPSNSLKNIESVHVADSVLGSRLIEASMIKGAPLYDLGSGNGSPGLIFALLYPTQSVIIVDRDNRKLEFCKQTAMQMELKNVTVLAKGVEEVPTGSVKNGVARGFAPFARTLLLCRKQVSRGGKLFHMKGDGWANELAQMPSQLFSHWAPSLLGQYRLPDSQVDMYVVLTEKSGD
jgi:16S rRNA (guanine527-N7)-methyltransferase